MARTYDSANQLLGLQGGFLRVQRELPEPLLPVRIQREGLLRRKRQLGPIQPGLDRRTVLPRRHLALHRSRRLELQPRPRVGDDDQCGGNGLDHDHLPTGVIPLGGSMPTRIANRRGTTPRRFALTIAAAAALTAVIVAVLAGVGRGSPKNEPSAEGSPHGTQRDPLSERLFADLVTEAERAPAVPGGWSRGRFHVLNKIVSGDVWRLAYGERSTRSCLVLLVPRLIRDGICGRHADVARRPFLVYAGAQPDRQDPSRAAESVVYGIVFRQVRSLRLKFSDCSTSSLALDARPLFVAFVPHAKLAIARVPYNSRRRPFGRSHRPPRPPTRGEEYPRLLDLTCAQSIRSRMRALRGAGRL